MSSFIQDTLLDGALRFSFIHPIEETAIELRLIPSGKHLYTVTRYGLDFVTTLNFEVLP